MSMYIYSVSRVKIQAAPNRPTSSSVISCSLRWLSARMARSKDRAGPWSFATPTMSLVLGDNKGWGRGEMSGGGWENMEKTWEEHGKHLGQPWKTYRNIWEKSWKHMGKHRKNSRKWWGHQTKIQRLISKNSVQRWSNMHAINRLVWPDSPVKLFSCGCFCAADWFQSSIQTWPMCHRLIWPENSKVVPSAETSEWKW